MTEINIKLVSDIDMYLFIEKAMRRYISYIAKRFSRANNKYMQTSHPATRHRSDVVATSLCTSQRRRRYISNERPNDVLVKLRQYVSAVRLYDILLKRRDDISRGRNNDVPSVRLHNVSNKSQMKHPTMSQ